MLEAIVFSDVHLDGLNKHFPDANDRIIREMDKIYQYALRNGIKHVIIAGDISDNPDLDWDTYTKLFLFFKKYDDILKTYYIAGNHDFADVENTSMNFLNVLTKHEALKNLHIYLKPKRQMIEGVPVNFLPFPCLETLSQEGKNGALNIAHVEYTGATGDNGRPLKTKHELKTTKNDFTISGHLHTYQYLKSKRALYCGNPFQKNFGEPLPKGFIRINARLSGKTVLVDHEYIENKPAFTLKNVFIRKIDDFKQLRNVDSIRYKLHIDPEVPVPPDLLIKYPNITGGIFISGKKATVDDDEITTIRKSSISIYSGLKNYLISCGVDDIKTLKRLKGEVKIACDYLGIAKN